MPYGQGWEQGRVDAGDTQCAENQLLHGQLVDNVAEARATTFYDPAVHDPLNPTTFVNKIDRAHLHDGRLAGRADGAPSSSSR